MAAIPDPDAPTRGLEWTLGQTAAHVISDVRLHRRWLRGEGEIDYGTFDLAARNRRNLDAVVEHVPGRLADVLRAESAAYVAEAGAMPAGATIPAETGPSLTVEEVTCVLLGELVVHGFDIARTLGRPWPIGRAEANLVATGTFATLPQFVNPETARDADVSYELRLRGGPCATVRIHHGELTVEPRAGKPRVDARISADAASFLLVGYGRIPQWGPILRGKLLAWGPKPWAAFRFATYLRNP